MEFLKRFWTDLVQSIQKSLFKSEEPAVIPLTIDPSENIVRGIFHPLLASKRKKTLKATAFLPPRRSNEFSTLRLKYTDPSFCKQHTVKLARNINQQEYLGLAVFLAVDVSYVRDKVREKNEIEDFSLDIKATPLDDLPMHSDVIYDTRNTGEDYSPNAEWRMAATLFCKRANFHMDYNPDAPGWVGSPIKIQKND